MSADAHTADAGAHKKFPRIPHVVNGPLKGAAVGRDDQLFTAAEASAFLHPVPGTSLDQTAYDHAHDVEGLLVTVEEKIDGACLGIFLDKDGGTLCCQTKTHFVNELTAPHWKGLQAFLDTNKAELLNLFYSIQENPKVAALIAGKTAIAGADGNPAIPATQWALYGEWTVARHAVAYNALPSPFLAFDIYSSAHDLFLSTSLRDELLAQFCPSVAIVPKLSQKTLLDWIVSAAPAGDHGHGAVPTDDAGRLAQWKTIGRSHQEEHIAAAWAAIHATWLNKPATFAGVEHHHEKPHEEKKEAAKETHSHGGHSHDVGHNHDHHKAEPAKTEAKPEAHKPAGICEGGVIRIETKDTLQRRVKAVHDAFRQNNDHDHLRTMIKNGFALA